MAVTQVDMLSDFHAPRSPRERLAHGEAHIWLCWTRMCLSPKLIDYYDSLLSNDERQRMEKFAFDHLKHEFLITRALCRTVLSYYGDREPAAWRFEANEYGRPEISNDELATPLRFNLSNTQSLIACIVALDVDVGVDVEDTARPGQTVEIADEFFSPREVAELRSTPIARQRERFFEYWTLKESYIKGRGMGLAIPLDEFSFDLRSQNVRIEFTSAIKDDGERWQFELFRPSDRHILAAGICRPSMPDFRISIREAVPGEATSIGKYRNLASKPAFRSWDHANRS